MKLALVILKTNFGLVGIALHCELLPQHRLVSLMYLSISCHQCLLDSQRHISVRPCINRPSMSAY